MFIVCAFLWYFLLWLIVFRMSRPSQTQEATKWCTKRRRLRRSKRNRGVRFVAWKSSNARYWNSYPQLCFGCVLCDVKFGTPNALSMFLSKSRLIRMIRLVVAAEQELWFWLAEPVFYFHCLGISWNYFTADTQSNEFLNSWNCFQRLAESFRMSKLCAKAMHMCYPLKSFKRLDNHFSNQKLLTRQVLAAFLLYSVDRYFEMVVVYYILNLLKHRF